VSEADMQLFRRIVGERVDGTDFTTAPTLVGGETSSLYQAYLGRVRLAANANLDVFVDDHAVQTGTTGTLIGNTARTWYDGISYAPVGDPSTALGPMSRPAKAPAPIRKRHDLRGRFIPPTAAGR
jgi:hypothetical protein